jgi:probable HAF family extracellular repeat protein
MTRRTGSLTRALAAVAAVGFALLAGVGGVSARSDRSGTSSDLAIGFVLDRDRIDKIDLPGDGSFTVLARITNSGRIVGKTPDEDGVGYDALMGNQRRLRRFEFPGAVSTYAQGMDERGRIVGDASPGPTIGDPGAAGYLRVRDRYTRIAHPDAVYTQAFGINNRGQVVGEYLDQNGVFHGYRWKNGRFARFNGPRGTGASITDINDRGDMVGAYPVDPGNPSAGLRGFLLRNGRYTTFSACGALFTVPFDINNRGQIAGTAFDDPALQQAYGFLLARGADGPATRIHIPGAASTSVYGLDDRGRLLGVYENPVAARRAAGTSGGQPAAPRALARTGAQEGDEMTVRTLTLRHGLAAAAAVALAAIVATSSTLAAGEPTSPSPIVGFVLDHGRFRTIEHPDAATTTLAFGINNRGQIVGYYDDADGRLHGFLRTRHGRYRTIDAPGAYATAATRINDRGQITGDVFTTRERFEQGLKRGFLLDRGRFIRVNVPGSDSTEAVGIDNRGRVVGETFTAEPFDASGYLWQDGRVRLIDVPGADVTGAEEINERGQIAGTFGDYPNQSATSGYVLERGRFRTFAAPGGPYTQVFGINNRGRIVGYVGADPLLVDTRGFIANGAHGPFRSIVVPGSSRTIAVGINDLGQIVGAYEKASTAPATRRVGARAWHRLMELIPNGGQR